MAMKFRALLGLLVTMFTMTLAGCGHYVCHTTFGGGTCTPSGGGIGTGPQTGSPVLFAYFADDNNGNINAAMLDSAANFNLISNFTEPTFSPAIDGDMVIVQNKWLYLSLDSFVILAYSIDGASGALSPIGSGQFSNPTSNSFSMTADPAGHFLFLSGDTTQQIAVFQINQTDGSLSQTGVFSTGGINAWDATTDGLGKFLYVAEGPVGSSAVAAFSIGSNGALTPVAGSPFSFPFAVSEIRGEKSGKFLFSVAAEVGVNSTPIDNHVYVYSINQTTGAIAQLSGSPFATTYSPYNLVVHPSGSFLYTFNENVSGNNSPMEGFSIGSNGALTALAGSPFNNTEPGGMFDQGGAYFIGHSTGALDAFSVNTTTGMPTSLSASAGIGSNFGWAVADPH